MNISWLAADFDEATGWANTNTHVVLPSHYRIDDALTTAKMMGANVVRSISLGWDVGKPGSLLPSLGGAYNENAFLTMDYAINKAGELGLYLIIALMDDWDYYFGHKDFFGADFWNNSAAIAAHRAYVSQVLNRVNTYNGKAYKDDSTILAWQTGNELGADYALQDALAAYIKTIDTKHLVMDGARNMQTPTQDRLVNSPHIDIVSCHFWPMSTDQLTTDLAVANLSNKVMFVDEYDWNGLYGAFDLATFLAALEAAGAVRGDMWWNLASHDDTKAWAYSTNYYIGVSRPTTSPTELMYGASNMDTNVALLRNHAYAMRGVSVPAYPALASAPVLSNVNTTFTWRGVAGAKSYTIERSTTSESAGFSTVATGLTDGYTTSNVGVTNPGGTWTDGAPVLGATSYYRIYGLNGDDVAGPVSNVVTLVIAATIIGDTFTDADGTLLTSHAIAPTNTLSLSWSNLVGTCKINGNAVTWNALSSYNAKAVVDTAEPDVVITADLIYDAGANRVAIIIARVTDASNMFLFSLYNGNANIQKLSAGVQTSLAQEAVDIVDNTTYPASITLNGADISFSVAGHTLTCSSSDFQTNTKHGVAFYNASTRGVEAVDNLQISAI